MHYWWRFNYLSVLQHSLLIVSRLSFPENRLDLSRRGTFDAEAFLSCIMSALLSSTYFSVAIHSILVHVGRLHLQVASVIRGQ